MTVQRYHECTDGIVEHANGNYVSYNDYQSIAACAIADRIVEEYTKRWGARENTQTTGESK
jgi:hypothetical protein